MITVLRNGTCDRNNLYIYLRGGILIKSLHTSVIVKRSTPTRNELYLLICEVGITSAVVTL